MGKLDPSKSIEALLDRSLSLEVGDDAEEYLQLIDAGEYQEALTAVEAKLSETPSEVGARLYWVECQLRVGQVPVTALTTPLEDILEELRKTEELLHQGALTYLRAGVVLSDKGQSRLSVTVLQWALELVDLSDELSKDDTRHVREFYLESLEEEIERAAMRREGKAYIDGLKEELSELRKKYKSNGNGKAKKRTSKKRRVFNSKSIIKEAESTEEPDSVDDDEASDSAEPKRRSGSSLGGVLIWLTSLTVVALGSFYLVNSYYPRLDNAEIDARLAMDAPMVPAAQLILPSMQKRTAEAPEGSKGSTSYDGVKERLSKLQQLGQGGGEAESVADPSADSQSSSTKKPKASNRREDLAAQIQADMERERKRLEAERDQEFKDNTPSLDPQRFETTPVEELDAGQNKTPVEHYGVSRKSVKDLQITSNGRVFGRPSGDGTTSPVGVSPVDGTPVRAIEVVEFKETTYFRTITATEVFSRPSLLASSLAHLEPDAKVQVVAKMGEWLELVSTGGRRGYIYAQDAVQVKEK
jgi:hypothetical protein